MKNLKNLTEKIICSLEEKDKIREEALKISRNIIRECGGAIQAMHRGEKADFSNIKNETKKLIKTVKNHPDLYYSGFVENAFQEVCETGIVTSVLENKNLPDPDKLGVTYTSYLLGMGDAVGEFRRCALDALIDGNIEKTKWCIDVMEGLYSALMKFDLPTGIVSIRKKRDVARSLIEKTRGELVIAMMEKGLEKKIDKLAKKYRKLFMR